MNITKLYIEPCVNKAFLLVEFDNARLLSKMLSRKEILELHNALGKSIYPEGVTWEMIVKEKEEKNADTSVEHQ